MAEVSQASIPIANDLKAQPLDAALLGSTLALLLRDIALKKTNSFVDKVKVAAEETSFKHIPTLSGALKDNWVGYAVDTGQLPPAELERYKQAKTEFCGNILASITRGLMEVQKRLAGVYSISFPKYLFAGTGSAAADVVAAAFKTDGVRHLKVGNSVFFSLGKKDIVKMEAVISAQKNLDLCGKNPDSFDQI